MDAGAGAETGRDRQDGQDRGAAGEPSGAGPGGAACDHGAPAHRTVCELVKSKRIEDRLTEDDRDSLGASSVP